MSYQRASINPIKARHVLNQNFSMVCVIPVSDEYICLDCYGVSQYGAVFLSHLLDVSLSRDVSDGFSVYNSMISCSS